MEGVEIKISFGNNTFNTCLIHGIWAYQAKTVSQCELKYKPALLSATWEEIFQYNMVFEKC